VCSFQVGRVSRVALRASNKESTKNQGRRNQQVLNEYEAITLPGSDSLDPVGDPSVLTLCRSDGTLVASFTRASYAEEIRRATEEDSEGEAPQFTNHLDGVSSEVAALASVGGGLTWSPPTNTSAPTPLARQVYLRHHFQRLARNRGSTQHRPRSHLCL
jgi:hypothetical protein